MFERSVFRIEHPITAKPLGTAFFVLPGLALTCVHVVRGCQQIMLASDHVHGGPWPASVQELIVDPQVPWSDLPSFPDIAVVAADIAGSEPLPITPAQPSALTTAVVAGFPRVAGSVVLSTCHADLDGKLSHSRATWLWKLKETEIAHGLSGGPVTDPLTGAVFAVMIATRGERMALGGLATPLIGHSPRLNEIIKRNNELQTRRAGKPAAVSSRAAYPAFFRIPEITPEFVGRSSDLSTADELLSEHAAVAITGLGGVGKTEIAAQFCHRYRSHYRFVWWFTAADRNALLDEYTSLAPNLGIAREGVDIEVVASQVREWLERQPDRYLLVFDNADDPHTIDGLVPIAGQGQALVTSRFADWTGSRFRSLKLNHLSAHDGGRLLVARTGRSDLAAATRVAESLGGLALALQQASALIAKSGWSFDRFAQLMKVRARNLLEIEPNRSYATRHALSVYRVWEHSIDRAITQAPAAREVLQILALLAAERIPRQLFVAPEQALADGDDIAVEMSLIALSDYSLIELSDTDVSLHRLIQEVEVARMRATDPVLRFRATTASTLLLRAMPADPDDCDHWDACARVVPHVLNLSGLVRPDEFGIESLAVAETLAGTYLNARGFRHDALPLLHRAVARASADASAPAVRAQALMNLARVERNLGDLAGALQHAEDSVNAARAPGAQAVIAASLAMLGRIFMEVRETTRAEKAYGEALTMISHGPLAETRLAVTVLNYTARAYMKRGDYVDAKALLTDALAVDGALHSHPHADTAWTLDNLAMTRLALEDVDGAERDLRRTLEIEAGIHGPDHPRSAWTLRNLAKVLLVRGDSVGARALLQRSLAIIEAATPGNRTEIVASAEALRSVCELLGDHGGARSAARRLGQRQS